MCVWGQSYVLGPNINVPMSPDDEPKALELAKKAVALKGKASPRERAYIDALAKRYTGNKDDRAAADKAYAEAMRALARQYPDDLDAQTMWAESAMDLRPWNYWFGDGTPYPGTEELVSTLERVLARNPQHPGAAHYLIHAYDDPVHAPLGLRYADAYSRIAPAATSSKLTPSPMNPPCRFVMRLYPFRPLLNPARCRCFQRLSLPLQPRRRVE